MITRHALLFAALLLLMVPPASADDGLARARARGALVIATFVDKLPRAGRDAQGEPEGHDIDVARELGRRMGLPVRFVEPGWAEMVSGDWGGAWDMAVASITPTAERAERVDFAATYRFDGTVLVTHRDNTSITRPADASGKRVGVMQFTTHERYLKRDLEIFGNEAPVTYHIVNPVIRPFPAEELVLAAVAKGSAVEVDAGIALYASAQRAVAAGAPIRMVPGFLFWEPVAVAVARGDGALAAAVQEAFKAMRGDGTLAALSVKWFGLDLSQP
jgi:polar amino acid transport system substrate-binding protein